jgi:hypothetical protein
MSVKPFELIRKTDVTGVSGTGIVAEGVVFENGRVVMQWRAPFQTLGIYDSIEEVEAIHCHGGLSQISYSQHYFNAEELGPEIEKALNEHIQAIDALKDAVDKTGPFN